jgi:type IV secretion system protein VirB8
VTMEPELEAYFREAEAWDADRVAMQGRSARVAWWVAGAGWISTMAAAIALMLLMPLKTVEPFVIRVDATTGLIDVVPLYSGKASMPEVVTRYFLDHYVTVCERFNFSTAESDYAECGAFHSAQRNQAWFAAWNKTNPSSPLNLYKDGTTIRAQVTSISFFTRADGVSDLAQVRYLKAKRQAGSTEEERTYWIASIRYTYGTPSTDPQVRRWNPLAFKVVDFRPEPEVIVPDATSPAGAPEPAAHAGGGGGT